MFFSKKILILLALLLLTTGCCRILMEVEAFNDPNGGYNPAQEPPDRFLCGTRAALAFPPTIPEAPLELVADIVCLPIDFVLLAYYLADPPLASLVEHNQLNRLERALKNGADPNKIDRRFGPYDLPKRVAASAFSEIILHFAEMNWPMGLWRPQIQPRRRRSRMSLTGLSRRSIPISRRNQTICARSA